MKFIADFHIHSHYSIATSKELVPEKLAYWAGLKGIKLVGTGDFTHPGWTAELREKLDSNGKGLFTLKEAFVPALGDDGQSGRDIHFILTAEISMIYKKKGRVRKVHVILFAPDFETVEKIQQKLKARDFNITSDGRPILGIDAKDLLDMMLSISEHIMLVPAHIWTPWFSILGAKSGFDTVEECFEDLSPYIYAVETGLSSDPEMNWLCSFLDKYTLISNSDAHSPEKLGRNATLFDTELSYQAVLDALKSGSSEKCLGTIDLFPQEGKYHYDGHRKCKVCWTPLDTVKNREICPGCGRKVTVGVLSRVCALADRTDPALRPNRLPFYSIIPLKEILSELAGCGVNTKKVKNLYNTMIIKGGSEFNILLNMELEEIRICFDHTLCEAIRRMRSREVYVTEGYDGEFGIIKVFAENEIAGLSSGDSLFGSNLISLETEQHRRRIFNFDLPEYYRQKELFKNSCAEEDETVLKGSGEAGKKAGKEKKTKSRKKSKKNKGDDEENNPRQQQAIEHIKGPAIIIAGPGTGKTRTLTYRIAHLISSGGAEPASILAVTFTNKAAGEMAARLKKLPGDYQKPPVVSTFHALGLSILRENYTVFNRDKDFILLDEEDKEYLLKRMGFKKKVAGAAIGGIGRVKRLVRRAADIPDDFARTIFEEYEQTLIRENAFDLEDLIYRPLLLFREFPAVLEEYRQKFRWILVDEYQDINFAQYHLIRLLAGNKNPNLCVIGDPDQAIYGFRGADVGFIRRFMDDYPGAKLFSLQKSYRCSQNILNAGSSMLFGKQEVLTGLNRGVKLQICPQKSGASEAEFIARTIENMIGGVRFFSMDSDITDGHEHEKIGSLSDFVILVRLKEQMKALEKACFDHGLPCRLIGDRSFFSREPVRTVLDILRLSIANPNPNNRDNTFLKEKLLEKLLISLETKDINTIKSMGSLQEKIIHIKSTYFADTGKKGSVEHQVKISNELDELCSIAANFADDTPAFLDFASLGTGSDSYNRDNECVSIMTLHGAKGLEFECVFIAGCEEGLIPYSLFKSRPDSKSGEKSGEREEERRLLYVGMTRAKKYLFLTFGEKRTLFNRSFSLERSSFLDSIEKELFEIKKTEYIRKKEEQPGLFD